MSYVQIAIAIAMTTPRLPSTNTASVSRFMRRITFAPAVRLTSSSRSLSASGAKVFAMESLWLAWITAGRGKLIQFCIVINTNLMLL